MWSFLFAQASLYGHTRVVSALFTGRDMLFNATNLITEAAAKSTKRLRMRRKKTTMKNKNPKKCEAVA